MPAVIRPLHMLLLALLLASPAAAAPVLVTRSQAREYLLTKGMGQEQRISTEVLESALPEIREHTLLALAWESLGRRLDDDQLDQLQQAHREIAVRLCRERRQRVQAVSPLDLDDYEQVSRGVYFASHILVEDQALAKALAARVAKGESFAGLARRYSKDPGSAAQGGSLGPVLTGQTVMEFEDALLRLKPGQFSAPVESPFGWHLIRLDSLRQREIEFSPAERAVLRQTLESHARRRAELEATARLWSTHRIDLTRDAALGAKVPAATVVARTMDTTLTRGQLDGMLAKAFGARNGLSTEGLGFDFLRFWVEQDAWLREARRDGTYLSRETLDLVDLRERLLKSALYVNDYAAPRLKPGPDDLENYLRAHEEEFLAERWFGLWTFEFSTKERALAARALSRKEKLDPRMLARRLKLKLQPRELSAQDARALPPALHGALIDLDPAEWSEVLDNEKKGKARRWVFYSLIGRRMPDLSESASLKRAVTERVRAAMITTEIARTVEEMSRRTGLSEVHWAD